MDRICGSPIFGLYLGGGCLVLLVWLAEPELISGLPIILHWLAAGCCLLRLLSGSDRKRAAAWSMLSLAMLASAASSLVPFAEIFLVGLLLGCLLIVPAFHWLAGTRSSFPPPDCAIAVLIVILQTLAVAALMPDETLLSIGGLAKTSLGVVFLCCCGSMVLTPRFTAVRKRAQPDADAAAAAALEREMLREAVRCVRAQHVERSHAGAAPQQSAKPMLRVKAA